MNRQANGGRRIAALALLMALAAPVVAAEKPSPPVAKPSPKGGDHSDLNFATQKSDTPLKIDADQGIEVEQDTKTLIARVNVKAVRGTMTVTSDIMIAHYRPKQKPGEAAPPPPKDGDNSTGGSSEIWRVEADGHVVMFTPTQNVVGDHADYNIDDAVVVVTGKNLRLTTPTDVITARDSLEYWEQRHQAVARGNAVAVRADKRIQADVLVADFANDGQKQTTMKRAHGYDHVTLTTPREVATGDRADYLVETGIVTLTGSVKMTRDDNQLDGGYAVVNLNTGISQVFPAPPDGAGPSTRQVKGLFTPQKKPAAEAAGSPSLESGSPAKGR